MQSEEFNADRVVAYRRDVVLGGAAIGAAILAIVGWFRSGDLIPALWLISAVLGGGISLIRIFEKWIVAKSKKSAIPVASLGILWIFKLVCLGIFVITLKSNPNVHPAIVVSAASLVFVPVLVGFRYKQR